jgi:hypothetical protein
MAETQATLSRWARLPDALIFGSITRDSNDTMLTATVIWPDGTPGTFTTDVTSVDWPGAIDAYHITYGSPTINTYTQPLMTRDTSGGVIVVPDIEVT